MGIAEIRTRLYEYINVGDDKLLKMMYAVAKEYNEDDLDYTMNTEELAEMERRRTNRLNGTSKTYNWDEAKEIITGKRQLR
jgi:hypothetical protein